MDITRKTERIVFRNDSKHSAQPTGSVNLIIERSKRIEADEYPLDFIAGNPMVLGAGLSVPELIEVRDFINEVLEEKNA